MQKIQLKELKKAVDLNKYLQTMYLAIDFNQNIEITFKQTIKLIFKRTNNMNFPKEAKR